ncbi:MAG TPA: Rieske (2Fe-2S) protein [Acidiferrobacterales bacterium]|nr:Rieske (2Fe-2S) protein [Acidiferrobacterales bacterium]
MGQVTAQPQLAALRSGDKVCASNELQEGGRGVHFLVEHNGHIGPAFAVRHAERVVAYLNRCAHKLVELDWQEGEFFDAEHRYLVCATHGALYDPASGFCVAGPCRGATLTVVPVREADGAVWLAGTPVAVVK